MAGDRARVAVPPHGRRTSVGGVVNVNTVTTSSGKVQAVCEFCGRMSRPVALAADGRLSLLDLPRGWSEAPYSPTFTHEDGSTGSLWQCPGCVRRLHRGEGLRARTATNPAVTRQRYT